MNAALAYARSRGLPRAAAIGAVIASATALLAQQRVAVPEFRHLVDFSVPVAEVAPVAYAVVLGTTLFSPMGDLEQTAAQPMRRHRAVHLSVLLGLAVALSALPLLGGATGAVLGASVRNVVGHLGLAMISARLFGSGLSWLLPLGMLGPTLLLGVRFDNTPEPWAWSLHPASGTSAAAVAVSLWVLGAMAAVTGQPRRTERAEQR
ncbi:hypothetical protein ACWGJT_27845 [Streptomyces xantholiticus]|uniref:Uncharacterized protein n=1 Tax=Streptomyces xantholiticus TaxID=68285 RepID=A0ABV1USG2_9ACTN|nr:hypothetical protein CGZ69_31585 [Streptomyces peucetius subsp. caesius ATCC 27952]